MRVGIILADAVSNQILDLVEVCCCTLRRLIKIRFPPSTLSEEVFIFLVKLSFDIVRDFESPVSQFIRVDRAHLYCRLTVSQLLLDSLTLSQQVCYTVADLDLHLICHVSGFTYD